MSVKEGQKVEIKIDDKIVLVGHIISIENCDSDEYEVVVEEEQTNQQFIVQFPINK
ncbi:MAG: hypothetical protein ACXW0J_03170 [Nitrososphaeraceae archaeon]